MKGRRRRPFVLVAAIGSRKSRGRNGALTPDFGGSHQERGQLVSSHSKPWRLVQISQRGASYETTTLGTGPCRISDECRRAGHFRRWHGSEFLRRVQPQRRRGRAVYFGRCV